MKPVCQLKKKIFPSPLRRLSPLLPCNVVGLLHPSPPPAAYMHTHRSPLKTQNARNQSRRINIINRLLYRSLSHIHKHRRLTASPSVSFVRPLPYRGIVSARAARSTPFPSERMSQRSDTVFTVCLYQSAFEICYRAVLLRRENKCPGRTSGALSPFREMATPNKTNNISRRYVKK